MYLEEIEASILAPYALRSGNSRGRLHPEDEPQYRTRFQRDRERILHTTAFRRLEYKTQVFVNSEGDYYRTRLTHTLEVAQLGRSIARAIHVNEDLTEAICLAHDLGHPPFGHSGEHVLHHLMFEHDGFEHNKQSYRIVTELERRYPEFPGLNLSWEVLEGIVKHETEYDKTDSFHFDPHLRGSLEAQIANVVDELAYTTSDLDDGLRSEILKASDLQDLPLWQELTASLGIDPTANPDELTRHRLIRRLVGIQVNDVVTHTLAEIKTHNIITPLSVQSLDHNLVGWSMPLRAKNKELKQVLYNKMYRHYRVMRMAMKAERILTELFTAYINEPRQLPPSAQELIPQRGLHRLVCDYLAGMTDRYAMQEYSKLFDPHTRP
ncbi:MAG TPA: deoxyguanosinetriphosphate triphosphohydrolase [Anaerolineales bacterium]|nr:deoxyguanosinetriphosphate triphosphohydrolase [Anaerolineales bacterium]